jgi:hypothetical protein
MSDPDAERQLRVAQVLALYETIESIATDQEDPRWRQATLLVRQLRDFGPEPDPDLPPPFAASRVGRPRSGDVAVASDRRYDGYAE